MADTKYDAIVVGAGAAGCAAAALLAKRGYRVALLERQSEVGGRASSFDFNGYKIDTGSHWIGSFESSGMKAIFDEVGAEIEMFNVRPTLMNFDIKTRTYARPTSKQRLGEDSRAAYVAMRDAIRAMQPEEFSKAEYHTISAHEWLGRLVTDPRILDAFRRSTGFAGAPMKEISAGAFIETFHDAWTTDKVSSYPVKGGCVAFCQALAGRVTALGGDVMTDTSVREVIIQDGRVRGVKAMKTMAAGYAVTKFELHSDIVICAVPGAQLFTILEKEAISPALRGLVEAITAESTIYFGIIAGVRAELFDGFGDGEQYFQFHAGDPDEHWHGLVTVPTYIDESLAPPGRHLVICNSHGQLPMSRRKEGPKLHDRCINLLREVWPGRFDSHVEWLQKCEYMNVLYPARVGRSGPFRASIQPTGVGGLNICGDYTYPGGSGYGCALKSARDVVNRIESRA